MNVLGRCCCIDEFECCCLVEGRPPSSKRTLFLRGIVSCDEGETVDSRRRGLLWSSAASCRRLMSGGLRYESPRGRDRRPLPLATVM